MTVEHHRDSRELHDWPICDPKDPEIARLVNRLAFDYGLRVCEIEQIIVDALRNRITWEEASGFPPRLLQCDAIV